MFNWINKSLRNKAIIALMLLEVIPIIIAGLIINLLTSKLLNTKMKQMAEQSIDNISLIVSKNLQGFIDIAFYLAQNQNLQNLSVQKPSSEIEKQNIFYLVKNELFNKQVMSHSDYPYQYIFINSYENIFTNFYYLKDLESKKIKEKLLTKHWYNNLISEPIPKLAIVVEKNLLSPRNEEQIYICTNIFKKFDRVGILLIGIDKYYISKLLEYMRVSSSSSIYIIDGTNCIIEGDDNHLEFSKIPASLIQSIASGEKNSSFNFYINGKNEFITYRNLYIKDVEGSWKIIQITASDYIRKEINYINIVMIGMTLLSILTVIILVISINKTIINPIAQLSNFAKQIQQGNLDTKIFYNRPDEIGTLAKVFNETSEKLKNYISSIKEKEDIKRQLEIEVLQSQINPHFIRNTLNIIRWLAEMTGTTSISKAIISIIGLINYNYYFADQTVTVKQEIKYLEVYKNYVTKINLYLNLKLMKI